MNRIVPFVGLRVALSVALLAAGLQLAVSDPVNTGNSGGIDSIYGMAPAFSPDFTPAAPTGNFSFTFPGGGTYNDNSQVEIFGGYVGLSDYGSALIANEPIAPLGVGTIQLSESFGSSVGASVTSLALHAPSPVPDTSSTALLLVPAVCIMALIHRQVRATRCRQNQL